MSESFSTKLTTVLFSDMVWQAIKPTVFVISAMAFFLSYGFIFDSSNKKNVK